MQAEPRVLAAFVRVHLEQIEGWGAAVASEVRAALAPELAVEIDQASRLSFLPFGHHRALTEASFQCSGDDVARAICQSTVLAAFEQPYLRPLVRSALVLVGHDFARFASWTPRAWSALFRDVGDLSWHDDAPGRGRLLLTAPAPALLESPPYVDGLTAAFSALFEATSHPGHIRATATPTEIDFHLRW